MINNLGYFIGRLTKEPEVKSTVTGKSVCSFSLAVDYGFGEKKKTIFPDFAAWGPQAEYVGKLSRGTLIAVTGELDIRDYMSKDGKRRKYEFTVRELRALQGKSNAETSEPSEVIADEEGFTVMNDEDMPF